LLFGLHRITVFVGFLTLFLCSFNQTLPERLFHIPSMA